MSDWCKDNVDAENEKQPPRPRAVAYYRHSAQDRQENSILLQQEQVQQFADENGVEIIKEFFDRGKSGLTAKGRDGFNDMMENGSKREVISSMFCAWT